MTSTGLQTNTEQTLSIGIFGGTFDPPHRGHLAAALEAQRTLVLDEVRFVVAGDPWQKRGRVDLSPAPIRLAMVRDLIMETPRCVASDVEIERGGPSYSIDTVTEFAAVDPPSTHYYLIIGADLVSHLSTWHRADELASRVTLAVITRPGSLLATAPPPWEAVEVTFDGVDCSSSELRKMVAAGDDVSAYLSEPVIRRIKSELLYAGQR